MLEISDLSLNYLPHKMVLRGVSLKLPTGKIGAIVGGNGVGKTTLLRCAARLIRPLQGRVVWRERSEEQNPGVAYLGEADYLYATATVAENLFDAADMVRQRSKLKLIEECFGFAQWWSRPVGSLSRGERRRVALARAWLLGDRLLLLDEPLVGLDPVGIEQLIHALTMHREAGGATLLAVQVTDSLTDLLDLRWRICEGSLCREEITTDALDRVVEG